GPVARSTNPPTASFRLSTPSLQPFSYMSDKKLSGKTAIITGASKGLGKAIALALGGAGAKLALVSRNKEQLDTVAGAVRKLGAEAETFLADVTDEQQEKSLARSEEH